MTDRVITTILIVAGLAVFAGTLIGVQHFFEPATINHSSSP